MSININSEASCRKAYLNYHCYGNTMGISAKEMGEITSAWESRLSSWQASVSSDENEYTFDDSEFQDAKASGKEAGQEATGYSGNDTGNIINGTVSTAVGAVGTGMGLANGGVKALKGIAGKNGIASKSTWTFKSKNCANGTKHPTNSKGKKSGSAYWQAVMAIATALAYRVAKPNKTEKEACDALQNEMANAQGTLGDTQAEMESMSEELIALSDEAYEYNEDANDEIEERKTEYDMYMASYLELKEKAESGEPLTEDEKALYKELVKNLSECGALITETQEDTTEVVDDIYSDMETYQDGYDYAAETMAEVEGLTDYAEGFDEATRTMCYVEAAGQTLNAASGAMAGAKLLGLGFWNGALAAASFAAAASSGFGAVEQFGYAGDIGNEIDARKATQDFNTETMDMYTEEIDCYDGFMGGVEDLELEIPDDIEAPEDTELPETSANSAVPEGTPSPLVPDDKKEEK